MGCLWSTPTTSIKCLLQLQEVRSLVQQLQDKYKKQEILLKEEITRGLRLKEDKKILMNKLKRKKILEHYMEVCSKRIDVLITKEYAIEQLNVTAMQIEALKNTVNVFNQFSKENSVEKIEKLQETLQELTDDVTDVNGLLESQPILEFDEEELEQELELLDQPSITPLSTVSFPVVPMKIAEHQDSCDDIHRQNLLTNPVTYA